MPGTRPAPFAFPLPMSKAASASIFSAALLAAFAIVSQEGNDGLTHYRKFFFGQQETVSSFVAGDHYVIRYELNRSPDVSLEEFIKSKLRFEQASKAWSEHEPPYKFDATEVYVRTNPSTGQRY